MVHPGDRGPTRPHLAGRRIFRHPLRSNFLFDYVCTSKSGSTAFSTQFNIIVPHLQLLLLLIIESIRQHAIHLLDPPTFAIHQFFGLFDDEQQ